MKVLEVSVDKMEVQKGLVRKVIQDQTLPSNLSNRFRYSPIEDEEGIYPLK